ncbi:21.7 kd protein [Maize streak virus - Reunion [SP1R10]]|nr:21.7 kd protein [Maize streak virus - Reunion [SP1R10]]
MGSKCKAIAGGNDHVQSSSLDGTNSSVRYILPLRSHSQPTRELVEVDVALARLPTCIRWRNVRTNPPVGLHVEQPTPFHHEAMTQLPAHLPCRRPRFEGVRVGKYSLRGRSLSAGSGVIHQPHHTGSGVGVPAGCRVSNEVVVDGNLVRQSLAGVAVALVRSSGIGVDEVTYASGGDRYHGGPGMLECLDLEGWPIGLAASPLQPS